MKKLAKSLMSAQTHSSAAAKALIGTPPRRGSVENRRASDTSKHLKRDSSGSRQNNEENDDENADASAVEGMTKEGFFSLK
mmetsp:Transcript_56703/g.84355  ORF Transcript_56703/g.84355 Transcript_56703/m.84355 type:complete len:81 (-) Transcript_56703:768-1010(-)